MTIHPAKRSGFRIVKSELLEIELSLYEKKGLT